MRSKLQAHSKALTRNAYATFFLGDDLLGRVGYRYPHDLLDTTGIVQEVGDGARKVDEMKSPVTIENEAQPDISAVCKTKMPKCCLRGEIPTKFSNIVVKENVQIEDKLQLLFRKPKMCSFSIYRKLMSGVGIRTVKCDAPGRFQDTTMMTRRLEGLEKLNEDVEAFMKKETGFERIKRYLIVNPNTFPDEHRKFVLAGVQITGLVAMAGFFISIYKHNKAFKESNKFTYKQRKFEQGRVLTLLTKGAQAGFRVVWLCTRIFAPIMVVTLGLTIYLNNTNPLNYALGLGVTSALNRNMMAGGLGFLHAFSMGSIIGLVLGTGMYFQQSSTNRTQDVLDREAVTQKLYHENKEKYS